MIPVQLERLILKGMAQYQVFNFTAGNYGQIDTAQNSFGVLHQIVYNPFINAWKDEYASMTWREFLKYNEITLQFETQKRTNIYFVLRNSIDFLITNKSLDIDLSKNIEKDFFLRYIFMQPMPPIIIPTYYIFNDYLKIKIWRNFGFNKYTSIAGTLNSNANEKPMPNGFANTNINLNTQFTSVLGQQTQYMPPSKNQTSLPNTTEYTDNYKHLIDVNAGSILGSVFTQPNDEIDFPDSFSANYPLLNLCYVSVNKQAVGDLSSL